jgi:uncharacterized protein (TIGR02145 family)
MKKSSFLLISIFFFLVSCNKEKTSTISNGNLNSNKDTSEQSSGINFTCIGTPLGTFQNKISDVEGNTYKTVKIGTQLWMAENLKTSKYSDGSNIPNITDNIQWKRDTTGAWSYYNNDAANNIKYGKLYNWYAVSKNTNGNKNLCPNGWHVPTDEEWTILTDYLDLGESVAGGKMKEVGTINWLNPNKDATNTSLFTGLPGGCRSSIGSFGYFGYFGSWWSSTESDTEDAWSRDISYDDHFTKIATEKREIGFSIRCVKD